MKEAQRISFFWDPRAEHAPPLAKRVSDTVAWFGSVEPLAAEWTCAIGLPGQVKRPEVVPATPPVVEAAMKQSAFPPEETGPPVGYEQETYLGTYRRHRAKLRLIAFTGGEAGTFPNRVELHLYERLETEALRKALLGMVAAFRPSYGFSSIHRVPANGAPPRAGFLTFLGPSFKLPPTLPGDAHVAPLASLGALIQLSTGSFPSATDDYRTKLAALQTAFGG